MPVAIISLCDGIGVVPYAAVHTFEFVAAIVTAEIDKSAANIAERHQPSASQWHDLTQVTDAQIQDVMQQCPQRTIMLVAAGSPCQNNSTLQGKHRQGQRGSKPSLIWAIVQLGDRVALAAQQADKQLTGHTLIENVPGTSPADVKAISSQVPCEHPVVLNANEWSPAPHKRLWWTSWAIHPRQHETAKLQSGRIKIEK